MSDSIERSIRTAELSLRMEGFSVTDACKELCRKLLAGEITLQEYLTQVISVEGKALYGVQHRRAYRGLLSRDDLPNE